MNKQTQQYKQLTQGQRYQIEALLGTTLMQKEIAARVGISESALSRELRRNASCDGYCAETAHALATERRSSAATGTLRKAQLERIQNRFELAMKMHGVRESFQRVQIVKRKPRQLWRQYGGLELWGE